jgi:lactoylglutathione lyase
MFNKVDAVVLFVLDLDRCVAFYRDKIGMEVVFSDDVSVAFRRENQDFLLLKFSAAVEMLGEAAIGQHHGAGHEVMLCADVDDVDAAYDALRARGVEFLKPPQDQPWGIRSAYFADPEGHLWELRRQLAAPQAD